MVFLCIILALFCFIVSVNMINLGVELHNIAENMKNINMEIGLVEMPNGEEKKDDAADDSADRQD